MSAADAISRDTTVLQLAGTVAAALDEAGITAVLSGGAAVAAYTENRYLTRDLDFVAT